MLEKVKHLGRATDRFVRGLARICLGLILFTIGSRAPLETPLREITIGLGIAVALFGAVHIVFNQPQKTP